MRARSHNNLWPLLLGAALTCFSLTAAAASPGNGDTAPAKPDWTLIRSLPRHDGGATHYVLVPADKTQDKSYYRRVANKICGSADKVSVFFWTDRTHVPTSEWMMVADMRVMTATYERHPNYKSPQLHLAAWLYPTKEAGERAHCFYAP